MSDDAKDLWRVLIWFVMFSSSLFSFFVGSVSALQDGRCSYNRAVKLFPPHVIACELFRDWSKK